MINLAFIRRLEQARVTRSQLAKHLRVDVKLVDTWLAEPLNKERSDILYRAMDEIVFHRYESRRATNES